MKRACILISVLFLVFSCKFTVNESKDKGNKDGFKYEEKISSINGNVKISGNKLIAGEFFVMDFKGVENATIKDGFKHIGISILIKDGDGNILDESEDLMASNEQQKLDYDKYFLYYAVPKDLPDGAKISFEVSLFDKYGDVSYDFKEEYVIIHETPPLTNGIKYETNSSATLGGQVFIDNCFQFVNAPLVLESDFNIVFYLVGLNDFNTKKDNFISANYEMFVYNEKNEEIFNYKNILEGSVEGMDDYYVLNFNLKYTKLEEGKYNWVIKLFDNNSKKYVFVEIPYRIK